MTRSASYGNAMPCSAFSSSNSIWQMVLSVLVIIGPAQFFPPGAGSAAALHAFFIPVASQSKVDVAPSRDGP
jgi:hypothetical protein